MKQKKKKKLRRRTVVNKSPLRLFSEKRKERTTFKVRRASSATRPGSRTSGRIGDFMVTIFYDVQGKITGDAWEAIPGTNARRATVFDTHASWAQQHNDYQALKK